MLNLIFNANIEKMYEIIEVQTLIFGPKKEVRPVNSVRINLKFLMTSSLKA